MPSVFPETSAVRIHPSAQPSHGRSPARADGSPFSELLDSAAPAQDAPTPDRSDIAEPSRTDAAPREDSPAAEPQCSDPSAKPAKAKPGKNASDCKDAKKTTDKPEASPEDAVTPGEPPTTEKPKIEGTAASTITAAADAVGNILKDADPSVGTAAPDPSLLFLDIVSLPASALVIPVAAAAPVSPATSTPILPPVVDEIGEIAATTVNETSVAAPGIAAAIDVPAPPVISAPAVPVPAVPAALTASVPSAAPSAAASSVNSLGLTLVAPSSASISSAPAVNFAGLTPSTVPDAAPGADAKTEVPQATQESETARPVTPFQQAAVQPDADETAPVVQPAAIAKAQISQNPQQPDTPRLARLIDRPAGGPKSDSPASPEISTGRSSTDPVTTNAGQGSNSSDSRESGKGAKTATHIAASDGAANSRTAHAEPQAELQVASGSPTAAQPQAAADSSSNLAPSPASGTVASATAINSQQTVSAAAPVVVAVPLAGLALEISARAQTGKNRFEIRLDPPELGRINVRLDVDRDGHVTSHLLVDRADTLDLLRRDASNLERALQQAGLKTSDNSLQFSLRDQAFSGRDQGDQTMPAMARLVVPDDQLAPLETMQRNYGRLAGLGSGVDIRV
ncbi:MAG: flagellar hook-length control protein FliK [Alphaproteobacteria bacterium]|nr:flagellar hook-length control protein FliK [Alphaproteobacteria bacterium]